MRGFEMTDEDPHGRARRWRNVALALALAGLVVLFYLMTMVRVHP